MASAALRSVARKMARAPAPARAPLPLLSRGLGGPSPASPPSQGGRLPPPPTTAFLGMCKLSHAPQTTPYALLLSRGLHGGVRSGGGLPETEKSKLWTSDLLTSCARTYNEQLHKSRVLVKALWDDIMTLIKAVGNFVWKLVKAFVIEALSAILGNVTAAANIFLQGLEAKVLETSFYGMILGMSFLVVYLVPPVFGVDRDSIDPREIVDWLRGREDIKEMKKGHFATEEKIKSLTGHVLKLEEELRGVNEIQSGLQKQIDQLKSQIDKLKSDKSTHM